jgi:hypothetical protein
MTENVISLLTARLDRIEKTMSESHRRILNAYFYEMMEEYKVDVRDKQAIRASQAMADIYDAHFEKLDNLNDKAKVAFEMYCDAKELYGTESNITKNAQSDFDVIVAQIEQYPDAEFADQLFYEKIEEYGVDAEDVQADRTVRAMNRYMDKVIELHFDKMDLIIETVDKEAAVAKKMK